MPLPHRGPPDYSQEVVSVHRKCLGAKIGGIRAKIHCRGISENDRLKEAAVCLRRTRSMDFEWHLACKLMRIRDLKDRQIAIFVHEEWLHFSYRYYLSIREASAATAASFKRASGTLTRPAVGNEHSELSSQPVFHSKGVSYFHRWLPNCQLNLTVERKSLYIVVPKALYSG